MDADAVTPPTLLVLDVNETLSDLAPIRERFADVGLPAQLAPTWFAGVLRDGMALTITGGNPAFADLARACFVSVASGRSDAPTDLAEAAEHIIRGFMSLPLHPDVAPGLRAIAELGVRIVTLSNGSAAVAQGLLERGGLTDVVERVMTVADAPAWKPDVRAYRYGLEQCGVEAADAMLAAVHPWDCHGATSAGMRAAYLDRGAVPYPGTMQPPEVTVASFVDLAERYRAGGSVRDSL